MIYVVLLSLDDNTKIVPLIQGRGIRRPCSTMRVLVALDDSDCSELAFESIRMRRWVCGTEFLLYTVVAEHVPTDPSNLTQHDVNIQHLQSVWSEEITFKLQKRAAALRSTFPNLPVSIEVSFGKPAEKILAAAREWMADLIVLGSHGRRGVAHLTLGSVSEAVVQNAPCSIEIFKFCSHVDSSVAQENLMLRSLDQRKILICFDGSLNSESALHWLVSGSWSEQQEFCLLTVLAPLQDQTTAQFTQFAVVERARGRILQDAETMLKSKAEQLRLQNPSLNRITTAVCEGYAVDTIVGFAKEWAADLVVLGAHTKSTRAHSSLGSVAKAAASEIPCSVKIVRAQSREAGTRQLS